MDICLHTGIGIFGRKQASVIQRSKFPILHNNVTGPGDDLAVERAGQVISGPQVVGVVVGVQLASLVQQGRGAGLDALHHDGEAGLVAVDIAVGEAVGLLLHQGLVVLAGEVHHELLHHGGGLVHVAAGGLVLRAVAVARVVDVEISVSTLAGRDHTERWFGIKR